MSRGLLRAALALGLAAGISGMAMPAYADSTRNKQWHVSALHLPEAQAISQGDGIIVAVIDSGVDATHPDLVGNVLPGMDFVTGGSGNGWGDVHGHGTGMAGLIAAHGHGAGNADGALGVAPKAKILPIRVFKTEAESYNIPGSRFAQGIRWAIAHGAKIISISADTTGDTFDAVKEARAAGIIVVGGIGNTNKMVQPASPASYDGYAVAVGGTDRSGNHATISLKSKSVDIAAPSDDITSTGINHGYRTATGTSDSTALVSGTLALIWSKYPDLTADQVINRLIKTATDKGAPGKDEETGYGLIDPVQALKANVPTATATPSIQATSAHATATASADASAEEPASNTGALWLGGGLVVIVIIIVVVVAATRRRS